MNLVGNKMKSQILLIIIGIFAAFSRVISQSAPEPQEPGPVYFAMYEGTCKNLHVADVTPAKSCVSFLMFSKFLSGRVTFIFQETEGDVIAFRADPIQHETGKYSIAEVVRNKETFSASGLCHFTLDARNTGVVECKAAVDGHSYRAKFVIARIKNELGNKS